MKLIHGASTSSLLLTTYQKFSPSKMRINKKNDDDEPEGKIDINRESSGEKKTTNPIFTKKNKFEREESLIIFFALSVIHDEKKLCSDHLIVVHILT